MASVSSKRKRGRPREEEANGINDFDIALIREFEQCPAFYDRSCVHYLNRRHIEMQWQEIAKNLGYNVSFIRDRMFLLRNRFEFEKKRLEIMQHQYNDPDITSQWSMYEYMTFLGDHINVIASNSKSVILPNVVQTKHNINNLNSSSKSKKYRFILPSDGSKIIANDFSKPELAQKTIEEKDRLIKSLETNTRFLYKRINTLTAQLLNKNRIDTVAKVKKISETERIIPPHSPCLSNIKDEIELCETELIIPDCLNGKEEDLQMSQDESTNALQKEVENLRILVHSLRKENRALHEENNDLTIDLKNYKGRKLILPEK